jgi:CDGSH-type Zn-finger protein
MNQPNVAQESPYPFRVEAGRTYQWCACGRSKSQPFCDGSHPGSGFAPLEFKATKDATVNFCGCKHSHTGALCDGTHQSL